MKKLLFPLALALALPTGATSVFAGGETHAVDDYIEAASAWFEPTKERNTVTYCTEIGEKSAFTEADLPRVREALESAFATWFDYIERKVAPGSLRLNLVWAGRCPAWSEEAVAKGSVDLYLIVGNDEHPLYEKYHGRFHNAAALTVKLGPQDSKSNWGKGAILFHPGKPFVAEAEIGTAKFPLTFSKVFEATMLHEVGHILGLPEVEGTIMDPQLVVARFVPMIRQARYSMDHDEAFYEKLDDERRSFFDELMLSIDDTREILFAEDGFYRGKESYREDVKVIGVSLQTTIAPLLEELGFKGTQLKRLRDHLARNDLRWKPIKGSMYRRYVSDPKDFSRHVNADRISYVIEVNVLDQEFGIEIFPDTSDLNSFFADMADVFKKCEKFHWQAIKKDRIDCFSRAQLAEVKGARKIKVISDSGKTAALPAIPGKAIFLLQNMSFGRAYAEGNLGGSRFSIKALERGVFHVFVPNLWDRLKDVFPDPKP